MPSNGASAAGAATSRGVKVEPGTPGSSSSAQRATPSATSTIKKRSTSPSPPPPQSYRDIPLLSSSSVSPWTHHLLRFAHHTRVDPTNQEQFIPPVKLNRKLAPKTKTPAPKPGDPVVDRYGKPMKTSQGQPLLWPKAGEDLTEHLKQVEKLKPQEKVASANYDPSLVAPAAAPSSRAASKPLFQKRVKQIHKAATDARRIHNDETLPWILEDFETSTGWESARTGRKDTLIALAKHLDEGGIGLTDDGGAIKGESAEDVKMRETNLVQHAPWIGKLEGDDSALSSAEGASAQVLFVFDERNSGGFKVIPIRKTYRFMQRSRFVGGKSEEDREKEYARFQRSRELAPDRFRGRLAGDEPGSLPLSRPSSGSSARTASAGIGLPGTQGSDGSREPRIKKEEGWDDDSWSEFQNLRLSAGPSRSRGLVAVSGGSRRRGGGDDDDDFHRKDDNEGGTFEELDYQEDFADDEERMGGDAELAEDNEAREMEDRLKREMAKAGIGQDEDDTDEYGRDDDNAPQGDLYGERRREDDQLTGSGRQMKKIMKALSRREGGEEYDSDDDVNPYASEESDQEEVAMTNPEEALRRAKEEKEREEKEAQRLGKTASNHDSTNNATPSKSTLASGRNSRGTTPAPSTTTTAVKKDITPSKTNRAGITSAGGRPHQRAGAGHADLAKRATAPGASGAASSRGGSPAGSRSPSPGREHVPRQSSPLADAVPSGSQGGGGTKRPASPVQSFSPAPSTSKEGSSTKRIKTAPGSGRSSPARGSTPSIRAASPHVISPLEAELIHLVRTGAVKSIAEVIAKFKKRLSERPELKAEMTTAFKRVLTGGSKNEGLRIREGF